MGNNIIDDKVPQLYVNNTNAVVGATSITYNESGYMYNQPGQIYGGADNIQDKGPSVLEINIVIP